MNKKKIESKSNEKIESTVTDAKLGRYFKVTSEALEKARKAPENLDLTSARITALDMVQRYLEDARHFKENGQIVDAFAALNYAHGWLDAGARLGLFDVHDSRLFTVD
mgnify:CR=1 FL=1